MLPVPARDLPFKGGNGLRVPGHLGIGVALQWFLSHGYAVSIPVEPVAYDLVAESDDGLMKIQVKTSDSIASSGRKRVRLTRAIWVPNAPVNSRGRYQLVPYDEDMVDFFFIAVRDGPNYLIPWNAVQGVKEITLDVKYAAFRLP